MNEQSVVTKPEYFDVASPDKDVPALTDDQIALIGGGQCTTNSI